MREASEHRQFKRYHAPEKAFAVISPDNGALGAIKDVSRGGLLFEYVVPEGLENAFKAGSEKKVSIFRSGSNLYIDGLPCEVVRDTRVFSEHFPSSSIPVNKCAVKFRAMSGTETEQLNSFLAQCKTSVH